LERELVVFIALSKFCPRVRRRDLMRGSNIGESGDMFLKREYLLFRGIGRKVDVHVCFVSKLLERGI